MDCLKRERKEKEMIYVYDILLNWFQKEEPVEFFEWELTDELEHIKKIPLWKVEPDLFKALYHHHIKIDKEYLLKIKNKTECYFQSEVETISFSCIVSDGTKCFALEFDETGTTIYKSTLLLDEEEEVLELVEELTTMKIPFQKIKSNQEENYLTRQEQKNKNYILKELSYIVKQKNIEKMTYLYEEYFPKEDKSIEQMYQHLVKLIEENDCKKYKEILSILKLTSSKEVK